MGTATPPPDDDRAAGFDEDELEISDLEEDFPDVEEIAAGDLIDPAMRPVIEAGGGVSEGFELAEAELIENATVGSDIGLDRILDDAPPTEAEPDRGVYGEADHELVDEDEDGEPEDAPPG